VDNFQEEKKSVDSLAHAPGPNDDGWPSRAWLSKTDFRAYLTNRTNVNPYLANHLAA
jgi:hypothetical protein